MQPVILLADDHSIIRKGLKLYIQLQVGYSDITEVGTCNALMRELVKSRFTHLVLDIILSDGSTLEIIPNIRRLYPGLQLMVFSMQPAEVYGQALRQYEIQDYLSKTESEEEIVRRLKAFLSGGAAAPPQLATNNNPFSSLAPRELEVLHYVLRGMGTKFIAEVLNLKMNTVSTIKTRIYEKTSASNIKELMELATLYSVNY